MLPGCSQYCAQPPHCSTLAPVETVRAFIAVNLSAEIIGKLEALQRQLAAQLPERAIRWTQPAQIHLTLKFLGNVATASLDDLRAALRQACANSAPFELRTGRSGCFPSASRPRVLWVGVEGALDALRQLQKRVDAATREFSAHNETREWQPHLTIGRVRDRLRTAELRKIGASVVKLPGVRCDWPVRSVELMQSTPSPRGSVYTALTSVEL